MELQIEPAGNSSEEEDGEKDEVSLCKLMPIYTTYVMESQIEPVGNSSEEEDGKKDDARKEVGGNLFDEDQDMAPPAPLEGSSHTTGGILRGKALGNIFNLGDKEDLSLQSASGRGIVKVHDILVLDHGSSPKMILKLGVCTTSGPVLRMLGKRAPYIEGD